MEEHKKLEDHVSKKPRNVRLTMALVAVLVVAGIGLIYTGSTLIRSGQISASTDNTQSVANPPVPPAPAREVENPPVPGQPGGDANNPPVPSGPNEFTFPAGWSMISALELYGYDLTSFKDSDLILYSFNESQYQRTWVTYPAEGIDLQTIKPTLPLGYYVYNPGTQEVKITLNPVATAQSEAIFARGWHLVYWPDEAASKDELFSKIILKYSDGTTMSAQDAESKEKHKISLKAYVVTNEHSIDPGVLKELTTSDSDTTMSKIPAKSYFWLYARRTKDRLSNITFTISSSQPANTMSATATATASSTP